MSMGSAFFSIVVSDHFVFTQVMSTVSVNCEHKVFNIEEYCNKILAATATKSSKKLTEEDSMGSRESINSEEKIVDKTIDDLILHDEKVAGKVRKGTKTKEESIMSERKKLKCRVCRSRHTKQSEAALRCEDRRARRKRRELKRLIKFLKKNKKKSFNSI